MAGFILYSLILFSAIFYLPPVFMQPGAEHFVFFIGGLALWRYSWGLVHYGRYWLYRYKVFPGLRARVNENPQALMPSQIYLLLTSFRIHAPTSIEVFGAAIQEAIACGLKTTLIASIVEKADETLIRMLFEKAAPPARVSLKIIRMAGSGKRDGLAAGFRAISRDMPPADAVVAVIDGDTVLQSGVIAGCVPFFKMQPHLGALTTDEICDVRGSKIMRAWHDLRFGQRQVLMCSLGLSRKVLALTGRMSMFRASIIVDPDFIAQVEHDSIDHWRLGRFKFLTGDDKSTWYWLLKKGWDMLYVPDIAIRTIEHPPSPYFFKASTQLMMRWYGNMLRTNGRALRLGPLRTGFFAWWCILDQRISMWTALSGPALALFMILQHDLNFLPFYLIWVGFTRWVMSLMLFAARGRVTGLDPFLIYYSQIWGSLIKAFMLFRLDRQSWTRQKILLENETSPFVQKIQSLTSSINFIAAMMIFLCAVGVLSGSLRLQLF